MKELTLVFNSALFERPLNEESVQRIIALECKLNDFLRGVETIGVGHCVNVHLDWRYEWFQTKLDIQNVEWISLKVFHTDNYLQSREAFSVIIHAWDTLKLKKNNNGDIVSIELINAEKE